MWGFLGPSGEDEQQGAQAGAGSLDADRPAAGMGLPSLWSVAEAVKQAAGDVVKSVSETDWKSELAVFSHEVQADAQVVGAKAADIVQHLPDHLPELDLDDDRAPAVNALLPDAAMLLPVRDAGDSSSTGALARGGSSQIYVDEAVATALEGVGASLSSLSLFGRTLLTGTRDVLGKVADVVESELSGMATTLEKGGLDGKPRAARATSSKRGGGAAAKYSRFEAEVAAMQRDSATYCEPPPDAEDFAAWRSGFSLSASQPDIESLLAGNAFMADLQTRLVPLLVEKDEFWARYFYRLHKLQQREGARQALAARAKALTQDEEELRGWDDEPVVTAGIADRPVEESAVSGDAIAEPRGGDGQAAPAKAQGPAAVVQQVGDAAASASVAEGPQEVEAGPARPAATAASTSEGAPAPQDGASAGGGGDVEPSCGAAALPEAVSAGATPVAPLPLSAAVPAAGKPAHDSGGAPSSTQAASVVAVPAALAALTAVTRSGPSSPSPSSPVQVSSDADSTTHAETGSDGSGQRSWMYIVHGTVAARIDGSSMQPSPIPEVPDAGMPRAGQHAQGEPTTTDVLVKGDSAPPLPAPAAGTDAGVEAGGDNTGALEAPGADDLSDDDWGDDLKEVVGSSTAGAAQPRKASKDGAEEEDWSSWG